MLMPRSLPFLSLAALALLVPHAAGQPTQAQTQRERFELFNACRPMEVLIETLPSAAADIGLTEEALQAAAESRLRAARLYTDDDEKSDFASLYVNVSVTGKAFSVWVWYNKVVTDAFDEPGRAMTHASGFMGPHGRNQRNVVGTLSQLLDDFLAVYLRVNEPACTPTPAPAKP